MAKILLVDDDDKYRQSIFKVLQSAGYAVRECNSSLDAISVLYNEKFDLVISDLIMQEIDGIQLLKFVKKNEPHLRTILLTAYPTAETELRSLNISVDRYLDKSIRKDVFLKYVEILLNEEKKITSMKLIAEEYHSEKESLKVNLVTREVFKDDELIAITKKEFDILCFLLENRNVAIERESIYEEIWDVNVETTDIRAIDTYIKSLRKKLRLISIKSIRGYGYRWNE
jgi:Response regulators consisting of a CheY-like receiver domain and a winged-helix DNA-binding domain